MAIKWLRLNILCGLLLVSAGLRAQVVLIPEIQSSGMVLKQQLWSVVINNLSGNSIRAILSVSVTDRITSQSLMESSSNLFIVNVGVKRVTYNELAPLSYSLATMGFSIDRQLNQPLPVGEYLICYNLTDADNKRLALATECIKVIAEPLSPPHRAPSVGNRTGRRSVRPAALPW